MNFRAVVKGQKLPKFPEWPFSTPFPHFPTVISPQSRAYGCMQVAHAVRLLQNKRKICIFTLAYTIVIGYNSPIYSF